VGYIATDRLHNRHVSMAEIFFPDEWPYQHVTFIVSWKHILKMAQLAPFGSRQEMFTGSCSMIGVEKNIG